MNDYRRHRIVTHGGGVYGGVYGGISTVVLIAAVRDRQLIEAQAIVRESGKAPAQVGGALPLSTYAGTYAGAWYGAVTVAESSYGLTLSFDKSVGTNGPLEHVDHDTFRTHWQDPAIENAKVTMATIRPVSPIADFSFAFQDLALVPDQSAKR